MKKYKIKSSNKAAFLNRLEKLNIKIPSEAIQPKKEINSEGEIENYFIIAVSNPEAISLIDQIQRKSAINEQNISEIISNMSNSIKLFDDVMQYIRSEIKFRKLNDDEVFDFHEMMKRFYNRII